MTRLHVTHPHDFAELRCLGCDHVFRVAYDPSEDASTASRNVQACDCPHCRTRNYLSLPEYAPLYGHSQTA
jgi:hypothetical protein